MKSGRGTTADLGPLWRMKLDGDVPAQDGWGSKAVVKDETPSSKNPAKSHHCMCVSVCGGRVWGARMREEGRAPCHRKLSYQLTWPQQDGGHGIAHSPGTEPSAWTLSGLPGRTQGLKVNPRPGEEQKRTLR